MKYGEITLGQVEAVVNKLGGEDGVLKFLRGEITVSKSKRLWREEDGVIRFSVTSDSTTGSGWIGQLESRGFRLSPHAKKALLSPDFKPTNLVVTEVAILKGTHFLENNRSTSNICARAATFGFSKPDVEVACLICEKFTGDEIRDMGLEWIFTMHKPIKDHNGVTRLLGTGPRDCFSTSDRDFDDTWPSEYGFAFAVPQV